MLCFLLCNCIFYVLRNNVKIKRLSTVVLDCNHALELKITCVVFLHLSIYELWIQIIQLTYLTVVNVVFKKLHFAFEMFELMNQKRQLQKFVRLISNKIVSQTFKILFEFLCCYFFWGGRDNFSYELLVWIILYIFAKLY